MDEFSWRNIHDARFQFNVKPIKKLDLEFDYHAFWLADTHDFWYRSNGISTLRTRTPDGRDVRTIGARNFAGQEIDLTATYECTKNVKVQVGTVISLRAINFATPVRIPTPTSVT